MFKIKYKILSLVVTSLFILGAVMAGLRVDSARKQAFCFDIFFRSYKNRAKLSE